MRRTTRRSTRRLALLLAGLAALATAPSVAAAPRYDATVRWTAYGIPHVEAKDYGSLGYGYAQALASQTICTLADSYVTVRAERSRWFGPDATYLFRSNSTTPNNLNSDFFYRQVIDERRVERLLAQRAPLGPRTEVRELVRGYVAGYNAYLARIGGSRGVTDPACRGQAWVRPISELDAYRRFYQLALLASSGVALDGIGGAQPPAPGAPSAPAVPHDEAAKALADRFRLDIGSNAVAVGTDMSPNGRGVLLGNPHFPWVGSERFFQAHLRIPGRLEVAGASLLGVPLVLIGHTPTMAWSHTVSTAYRFTPFQLAVVPGRPTTYLYDGQPTDMVARKITVKALVNGRLEDRSRTLYSTRFGPVLTSLLGLPIFPWTHATAFAMGDANAPNFRYLNHFFEVDHARSSREVLDVLKRNQGIPWVNTIAADDQGDALYADISVTPHVTDEQAAVCATPMGQATFQYLRLPVLDGSRSDCEWGSDPDSLQRGTFGPSRMPAVIRSDYVANMNDSYWLTQPRQPIQGYDRIIGDERTARALRTRSGLVMLEELLLNDGKISRQDLQDILYSNRQHAAELVLDDVVAMCRSMGPVGLSSNGPVQLRDACDVLSRWDRRDDVFSRGALLFRRFWQRASSIPTPVTSVGTPSQALWLVPFDASQPWSTPRALNTYNPVVRRALADAVADLDGAGIKLDAMLGTNQVDVRPDGTRIPYHGGPGGLGVFNALNASWDPKTGYATKITHGSSYIQTVAFDGDRCPDVRTILTYSQSTNPRSQHYADQTRLYRDKRWLTPPFCARDVARETRRTERLVG